MGMSKALMEKVMIAKSRILNDNKSISVEQGMEMSWGLGVLLFHFL